MVVRERAQRGPAACAGGAQRIHGGAAANRRRWRRICSGRWSGRMRGLRGSSPCTRFGRRRAGGGSSTERAELGEDDNGGRRSGPDFGRCRARPSSWRGGVDSGQGCAALGARNRSGVARGGGAELGSGSSSSLRDANARNGEGNEGLESSRPVRGEERRQGARADAWKLIAGHSSRYGVGAAQCQALEILCSLV